MRHIPPASRRTARPRRNARAVTALLAVGLLAGPVVLPSANASDLDDKKRKVEGQVHRAEDSYNESSAELQAATAQLLKARDQLTAAQAYLTQTRGELAAAEALDRRMQALLDAAVDRLNRAQLAVDEGQAAFGEQEARLRQIVVAAYEQGDPALMGLSMVFTTQDPAQLTGQLNADDTVLDVETTILDQLEAGRVLLQVKESELQDAKAEVAQRRQEAAANLRRKEELEQQARQAKAEIVRLVEVRKQATAAALRAKQADLRMLEELRAEQKRIERLIMAQRARQTGSASSMTLTGEMSWPVDGYVTSPFGWRIHPVWGYRSMHDGIDVGAGCGVPVRAAADGTVLQTYFQTALGNRIVMDNGVKSGARLATAYNHLSGFAVSAGTQVQRGDVIGYVGNTGWSTGCHLHFTVLENGAPVDPMKWL